MTSVSQTPGLRFSDLSLEEQDLIQDMRVSQICLESWPLTESEKQYHRDIVSACARALREKWYPAN